MPQRAQGEAPTCGKLFLAPMFTWGLVRMLRAVVGHKIVGYCPCGALFLKAELMLFGFVGNRLPSLAFRKL
jgi:hypothetical protein